MQKEYMLMFSLQMKIAIYLSVTKLCNYFSDFGQCKFTTYCRYKHEKRKDAFANFEKNNDIEKKLHELLEADGERRNID